MPVEMIGRLNEKNTSFNSIKPLNSRIFGLPYLSPCFRITLGNQLDGIHLLDPDVVARFKQRYPDGIISKPKNL